MPGGKGFESKAQMRKFFADPKLRKYAHRWAHEAGMNSKKPKKSKAAFDRLPDHVKRGKRKRKSRR